ncbi:hypothetical protein QUA51_12940 [Microcoleus sp. Pol10_D6]|uniref:hypothetical protein n=1 Tax=unclassified Microcoleus TaxID=2642155 RepID=UPI002FCE99F2
MSGEQANTRLFFREGDRTFSSIKLTDAHIPDNPNTINCSYLGNRRSHWDIGW